MSRIRSSGTLIERRLFGIVREELGHRLRIRQNVHDLPGNPDVFIPRLRLVIFIDGCFYHACPKHGRVPSSNTEYWTSKLERNRQRDAANRARLRHMGFRVWRFWEHDLETRQAIEKTNARLHNRLCAMDD